MMKVAGDSSAGCQGMGAGPSATARAVTRAWRELTGGTDRDRDLERRTLIACSGGGDSCGLVLALAAGVTRAREVFVVGHIVHDLRAREEALGDRDAARSLAERVGLPFVEGEVQVRAAGGNLEGTARRLRYGKLARLASETGCGFVATAHHADDQLETILMSLVRGAGPRGLAGIAPRRRLGAGNRATGSELSKGIQLIRPALGVRRDDLQRECTKAGWKWREDGTNLDESRLRGAIRARVVPELERIRPGAAVRAVRAAAVMRGAAGVVTSRAAALLSSETMVWPRADLRREPEVVLGELIRLAVEALAGERDKLSSRVLNRVASAIRDSGTEPRKFLLGGLVVEVSARRVKIGRNDG